MSFSQSSSSPPFTSSSSSALSSSQPPLPSLSADSLMSWASEERESFRRYCDFLSCCSDLLSFSSPSPGVWSDVEAMLGDGLGGLVSCDEAGVKDVAKVASAELEQGISGLRKR